MVTNYYNASNHFSKPVRKEPAPYRVPVEPPCEKPTPCGEKPACEDTGVLPFRKTDTDTALLCGLLVLLFFSGCRDKWLLAALLYLLVL